jgi:hypothetical protein
MITRWPLPRVKNASILSGSVPSGSSNLITLSLAASPNRLFLLIGLHQIFDPWIFKKSKSMMT